MASSDTKNVNPNGVYLIYDKEKDRNEEEFYKILPMSLHINSLTHKEGNDPMYIAVLPKDFYDNNTPDELLKAYNIVVRRFRPPLNDKLREGTTYGLYITSDATYPEFSKNLLELFSNFEKAKFINNDSYEILMPAPYPNGNMRNYAVLSFRKNDKDIFPKSYIRKIKVLLNGSKYNNITFKVDWVSVNVMRDIKKGNTKDKKEPVSSASA